MNARQDNSPPSDDAAFEGMLRSAMAARPEPEAPFDLARRAMELARRQQAAHLRQQAAAMARQRRFAIVSTMAAAVMIAALLAVVAERLWARGDIAAVISYVSSDSASTSTTSAETDSSTSSSTSTTAAIFVGELLLLGVILLSVSRGAAPSSWAPEAAAGMW